METQLSLAKETLPVGMLPTPPYPGEMPDVQLTENARQVLMRRYVRRGDNGQPAETVEGMFWRVAYHVASVEQNYGQDPLPRALQYYDLLTQRRFFPNSPTFTGAGTPLGQLAACFVLPISDDMGRNPSGIFQTLRDAALIQQTGGGNGFSFSRLRPKGAHVRSSAGQATGPVGFLRVYDHAFGEIAQGGCLIPSTLVFTDRGLLRLDEIVDDQVSGWQPHTLRVPTDEGIKESPRSFNNGIAPTLRVSTSQGLEIQGTPEHRVKVMSESGPQWRNLTELKQGDWILVKLGQHTGKLQALRQPTRSHGNQEWPMLPAILDEEMAFFLGILVGDGFVAADPSDHRIGVSVSHDSYLIEEMPALLQRLFGVNVHRQQKANDRSVTFVIDNRAVKEFLLINGLEKSRSRMARVPRLIRQSPQSIVGAFLRGLFEADGSVSHGYPTLSSTSAQLIEEVSVLLIGLGCPVRIRSITPGIGHFGKASQVQLRIEANVGLEAWREKIGCDRRSRLSACYQWNVDESRESSYPLPHPRYWLQPVLDAITLEQVDPRQRGTNLKFRSGFPRLRRSILRYYRADRTFTRSAYEMLRQSYPEATGAMRPLNDLWFVKVTEVTDGQPSLTLDLEVDDNHTYLANGMVTHNTRRGANMAVLRVDHPDVEEFITCKIDENSITNFNISVGITDAFMRAVQADAEWELRFPDVSSPKYKGFTGTLEQAEAAGIPIKTFRTVRARELFNKIVRQAHHNGEPGVLFLDAANRENPVPHLYPLESTNPCGEQFLGPYENCCLGSINLAEHLGPDNTVDWEKLHHSIVLSTQFLDNVVDANAYVPAVPQLREAAQRARRIGLGIMGLSDLMYHVGVRYGSEESLAFAAQVMEFIRYHCMLTSIELAEARGPFPAISGSLYDPADMAWRPPEPAPASEDLDWGRPAINWERVTQGVLAHGIRNAAQTTIAPTGTIATVAGCEGYGCEPVFALAYIRHVNDNGKDLQLTYASPLFERALAQAGISPEESSAIMDEVMRDGTCQALESVPESVRNVFVVSADISAEEHVRMQAALQRYVDNSLSKTINFPPEATVEDVATAYQLAWELGCKGITVYVTGSRSKVVLETKATAEKKQPQPAAAALAAGPSDAEQLVMWHENKKPRPRSLRGFTYQIDTPLGKAFVTINENGGDQPFEVFINTAKAGSDTAAVSEAIGRLISYILRLASSVEPRKRLEDVQRQLSGIGGGRSLGFGPNRVRSLPDGVAIALDDYLSQWETEHPVEVPRTTLPSAPDAGLSGNGSAPLLGEAPAPAPRPALEQPSLFKIGDLCPECGQAAVVNEEGCRKCYSCGFSEC